MHKSFDFSDQFFLQNILFRKDFWQNHEFRFNVSQSIAYCQENSEEKFSVLNEALKTTNLRKDEYFATRLAFFALFYRILGRSSGRLEKLAMTLSSPRKLIELLTTTLVDFYKQFWYFEIVPREFSVFWQYFWSFMHIVLWMINI